LEVLDIFGGCNNEHWIKQEVKGNGG